LTDLKKRLLDEEAQNDHVAPFFSMSDHTLPVTDIICGVGMFPDCRVLTSSIDHSVKVFYIFDAYVSGYLTSIYHTALGPSIAVSAYNFSFPTTDIISRLGRHRATILRRFR
jgi:hypothetical protein